MHIANWIYLGFTVVLLSDVLYMFLNFQYSYHMYKVERESMYSYGDPIIKRRLDGFLVSEYGFGRIFIKGVIYYIWFILGFFLQYWYLHVGIFLFNYMQEMIYRGNLNVPEFSYFLKLSAYLVVYLAIIHQLIM